LGHNGAGKTTAINLLTGMLRATSGDALIFGRSLQNSIDAVRQRMGLCQQFDVLFDDLTIEEHLKLVCDLKCMPVEDIADDIYKTL
jgi:ATP-binding cassette subfamily A (ABC1) protein 3